MCTLTYLPKLGGGFTLTSSRDESPARAAAHAPQRYVSPSGVLALYAKDPLADGTWLLSSDQGLTLCLLNGGFVKHTAAGPYRHSRGLVPLHYLAYAHAQAFVRDYPFTGLEPFTLIVLDEDRPAEITQITWDGAQVYTKLLPATEACIWSSATLYPPAMQAWRQRLFANWLQGTPAESTHTAIIDFHLFAGQADPENAIRMHRQHVETVSITTVCKAAHTCQMIYRDLVHHKQEQLCLVC